MADKEAAPARRRVPGGELARFAAAGVLGLAVDVLVLYGTIALGLDWFSGRVLSFLAAVWSTWQFNRHLTFRPSTQLTIWEEWWRYLSAMLAGGIVNYAAYSAVVLALPGLPLLPIVAVAIGSLSGMMINFISAKYFVFRNPS